MRLPEQLQRAYRALRRSGRSPVRISENTYFRLAPKRPRDPNQLAKLIADMATGQAPRDEEQSDPDAGKNPHAVALGDSGE